MNWKRGEIQRETEVDPKKREDTDRQRYVSGLGLKNLNK